MELLRRYNIEVEGKKAVVIGRSNIVGFPMSVLLQQANATVTVCHSRTKDMDKEISQVGCIHLSLLSFPNPMLTAPCLTTCNHPVYPLL